MALLTNTKAKNIQPGDKPLPHGGITGLTLHPSSTKGRGKWVLRYMSPVTQKRRNAGLGSYPEITISEVSNIASIMREQIIKGIDPLEFKNQFPRSHQSLLLKMLLVNFILNYFLAGKMKNTVNNGSLHWNNMYFHLSAQ